MNFGCKYVFLGQAEPEEIFQDEVEDGIATCAMAQAEIWAEDAAKGEAKDFDQDFVKELLAMGNKPKIGAAAAPKFNDAQTTHAGVFSAGLRLQPRFEVCSYELKPQLTFCSKVKPKNMTVWSKIEPMKTRKERKKKKPDSKL